MAKKEVLAFIKKIENETDDEAIAKDEAACGAPRFTSMEIPANVVG
jgi:hypothetical protein